MNSQREKSDDYQALETLNWRMLSYRIAVPSVKFAQRGFIEAVGTTPDESRGWKTFTREAGDPKVDYHVHVYWRIQPDNESQLQFQVDFHAFPQELKNQHSAPYAEEFMDWAGKFFEDQNVTAHIHGEFEYPLEGWKTKLVPLPVKIPYEEKEAIIEGLEFKFPSKPEGVHNAWLLMGSKMLEIQVFADRPLVFKKFSPHNDVRSFVTVLKTLIEEKQR